jgi:hypothetical protein
MKPRDTEKFFKILKDGDILKDSEKVDGWSCTVQCVCDDRGTRWAEITGRLNQETPFKYYMLWDDLFEEYTADIHPVFWAELVALGPRGEKLGFEAVASVKAYLEKTPNPPSNAPRLVLVIFALRSIEWTEDVKFSGDMLEDFMHEEGLIKVLLRKERRFIKIAKNSYYEVYMSPADGSLRFTGIGATLGVYNSQMQFIAEKDKQAADDICEGYVLSVQRSISSCPTGQGAWETDRYGTYRDRFSVKRRPGAEPSGCVLCVKFRVAGKRHAFLLYAQSGDHLVFCGALDIQVCSRDIKSILWKLNVVNEACELKSECEADIPFMFKKIRGDDTNWFLDNGYILEITATWLSWKHRILSGIKFTDKGKAVADCDIIRDIMDLNDLIKQKPYIRTLHENTLRLMQYLNDLKRGCQPVCYGAGGGAAAADIQEPDYKETLSLPTYQDGPLDDSDSDSENVVEQTLLLSDPPSPPVPVPVPVPLPVSSCPDKNKELVECMNWAHMIDSEFNSHLPWARRVSAVRRALRECSANTQPVGLPPTLPASETIVEEIIVNLKNSPETDVNDYSRFEIDWLSYLGTYETVSQRPLARLCWLYTDMRSLVDHFERFDFTFEQLSKISVAFVKKHDPPENALTLRNDLALSISRWTRAVNSSLGNNCRKRYKGRLVADVLRCCQRSSVWDETYPFEYCSEGGLYNIVFGIKGAPKDLLADMNSAFSEVYTRRFSETDLERLGEILVDKYVESDEEAP